MYVKTMFVELPYDPAVSLLSIYPEKTITPKDTFTPMFTAALFAIARTWKHPKCPLTDEWIKKVWCTDEGGVAGKGDGEVVPVERKARLEII